MIERLRLRIVPLASEPAHGIAARLAARHGMPIGPFVQSLGFGIRSLATGRHNERLAALASMEAAAIRQATAHPMGKGRSVTLRGESLSCVDWNISSRRVCTACLSDDRASALGERKSWAAWHRPWWDVQIIRSCPIHKRELINRCQQCNEHLDWDSDSIDRCPRGHLLAEPSASHYPVAGVDAYVMGRLNALQNFESNPFLDALPLGNVARIVERLGAIAVEGWALRFADHGDAQLVAKRRAAGWELVSDLEGNLREALDRVLQQAPKDARGLVSNYGWIYASWLGVPGADHSGGRLLRLFRKHAVDRGIISGAECNQPSATVDLKTASALLSKGRTSARAIVQAAGILPSSSRPGVPFCIDGFAVDKIAKRIAMLVDCQTGTELLGIGRAQFRSLVDEGLLKPDDEALALGYGRLFDPNLLMAFQTALGATAPIVRRIPHETSPLPAACRSAAMPVWKFCQLILQNTIVPAAIAEHGRGLGRILIAHTDIKGARKPRSRPVEKLANALRIHRQAASQLIQVGAFGAPPVVTDDAIAAFQNRYVKPSELGTMLGRSGRSIIRDLADANLRAGFGPPHCRQLFYPRQQASATLQSAATQNTIH